MNVELCLPPELIDEIANRVFSKIKPYLKQSNAEADTNFNVKSLAVYLNVSTKWVYERTHLKEIPHFKAGGILGFRKKEIDKWILTNSVPCSSAKVTQLMRVV